MDPLNRSTDAEVQAAVDRAQLGNWVDLSTEVSNIASGGQRQLVCLARAFLRNSAVVFLDEATSSVDVKTEELVARAIAEDFSGRTVVAIAHRLATLQRAQRVLVLEKGTVAEFDAPAVLLKKPGGAFKGLAAAAQLAPKG